MTVLVCPRCGYVELPENTDVDRTDRVVASLERARGGAASDRSGRQYEMAQLGIEVLDRSNVRVLLTGSPRSLDYAHIACLPVVGLVAILDVNRPVDDRFDVVIASEVVERFADPLADFGKLFGYLERDGVLVCSTTPRSGARLGREPASFNAGNVSAYTPESLRRIAEANRARIAFRVPRAPNRSAGDHERYAIFARSAAVSPGCESRRAAGQAGNRPIDRA